MKKTYQIPMAELLKIDTIDPISLSLDEEGTGLVDDWEDLVKKSEE